MSIVSAMIGLHTHIFIKPVIAVDAIAHSYFIHRVDFGRNFCQPQKKKTTKNHNKIGTQLKYAIGNDLREWQQLSDSMLPFRSQLMSFFSLLFCFVFFKFMN